MCDRTKSQSCACGRLGDAGVHSRSHCVAPTLAMQAASIGVSPYLLLAPRSEREARLDGSLANAHKLFLGPVDLRAPDAESRLRVLARECVPSGSGEREFLTAVADGLTQSGHDARLVVAGRLECFIRPHVRGEQIDS